LDTSSGSTIITGRALRIASMKPGGFPTCVPEEQGVFLRNAETGGRLVHRKPALVRNDRCSSGAPERDRTEVPLPDGSECPPLQGAGADRPQAGHTSVSVGLDRYEHLFPGHEADVLDRLDGFAADPSVTVTTAPQPLTPRGAAGFSPGEREGREPKSSRHSL